MCVSWDVGTMALGRGCPSPDDLLPLQPAAPCWGWLLALEVVAAKCKVAVATLEASDNSPCEQ